MAKVIILSGAGISAESGISTFRDSNGLWENHKISDICIKGCFENNRENTIKFYDKLRTNLKDKKPNHAHNVIAALKNKYPNDIDIITQNIDDLFEKAKCRDILHLHGFLKELVCVKCEEIINIGYEEQLNKFEDCPECKNPLRPNIVFFNEPTPNYEYLYDKLKDCEVLVVIGSSGAVVNTDFFVLDSSIKMSILNNLEHSVYLNENLYSKVLLKKATEAIDEIANDIEEYLNKDKPLKVISKIFKKFIKK
ncbi:SIR2 family NAD-dependent protein deacylase [Aliarcobacter butzleri]|uniref:SIR2 family NAD-dependent protein deacylase n=1 Tax=Aliarcobacter butzleri TaxID=28197 RepID=UPI001269CC30|nr:Sir2 family NAD-dependent protein deacetylase [Aliarcobacter butzleri]